MIDKFLFIKMTICDFQLNPTNLGKLPSVKSATEICLHIIDKVLQHLSETLMEHCSLGQQSITNHLTTLQWHLGILSRSIPGQSECNYAFKVHRIYTEKKSIVTGRISKKVFSLEVFEHTDSKLLLEFAAQILENNLRYIKTCLTTLPNQLFNICSEKVGDAIWDLTFLIGDNPDYRNKHGTSRVMLANLDNIRLIVELFDQNNQITFFDHAPPVDIS